MNGKVNGYDFARSHAIFRLNYRHYGIMVCLRLRKDFCRQDLSTTEVAQAIFNCRQKKVKIWKYATDGRQVTVLPHSRFVFRCVGVFTCVCSRAGVVMSVQRWSTVNIGVKCTTRQQQWQLTFPKIDVSVNLYVHGTFRFAFNIPNVEHSAWKKHLIYVQMHEIHTLNNTTNKKNQYRVGRRFSQWAW